MIAKWRKWPNPETFELAKALDAMGFESTVRGLYDRWDYEGLSWQDQEYELAPYIEKKVNQAFDRLWEGSDEMERELIRYRNSLNIDYYDISSAYTEEIRRITSFNAKPGRTSGNAETSLRKNRKGRTGRIRNGNRFLRIHQQAHPRIGAAPGRLSLGIRRLD